MEHIITDKSKEISEAISIPVNQLYTVASYINRNNGDITYIEDLAYTVVDNEYIRNLIIAPDGIVTKVFPMTEDNKNVLGLDYNMDISQGNKEAILAAKEEELLLAGPFTTVVGDKAISGRYPVILTDEEGNSFLWGILSITLKYPEVMNSINFDSLSEQGYIYELWHTNVDTGEHEIILSNGEIKERDSYVERKFDVLNAEWYLKLAPIPKWYQYIESWIYLLLSLLISITVALMVRKNIQLNLVKKELEVIVQYDSLTKILNRQGLFNKLNELIKNNIKFLIYYLDLDKFKQINDMYGHDTGDYVLKEFSRRVSLHLDENHIFARMGGDEFIVVSIEKSSVDNKMDDIWNKIYEDFKKPILKVEGEEIYISFSKGVASYLLETDKLHEVISKADQDMYLKKREAQ